MNNQHRKIVGYRDLTETEIDLMNEVKSLGPQIEEILLKIEAHISSQRIGENITLTDQTKQLNRMDNATPERFLAIGKTHLQQGLMAATRAVAQPEFF